MFMLEQNISENPPPYMKTSFTSLGRDIIAMIAYILDFSSNEYVDEMTFSYMTIFTFASLLLPNMIMLHSYLRKSMISS